MQFWNEHVDDEAFVEEANNQTSFFATLADLTLDGWLVRWNESINIHGSGADGEMTPVAIRKLQHLRPTKATPALGSDQTTMSVPDMPYVDGLDFETLPSEFLNFGNGLLFDFGFWNDISDP
jgi:hypothetical protein